MVNAERESLRIRYAGPALETHAMDVRQLAPSLLALAEVFDLAHQEASDGYTLPPALEVRATEEGSFVVDLLLAVQEGGDGIFQCTQRISDGDTPRDRNRRPRRDQVEPHAETKRA